MPLSKVKTNSITDNAVTSTQVADNTITTNQMANTAVHGRRNLVDNGAMLVSQKKSSWTGLGASTSTFTIDRFRLYNYTGSGVASVTHSTEAPDGFSRSFKVDCTTADTALTGTQEALIIQYIEAQNLQHLNFGSSNPKQLTLSFWVRSNKTGTYVAWLYQSDGADAAAGTYTINTANTWEHKSITVNGNTLGAINNDNGHGIGIHFVLAAGPDFQSGTQVGADWASQVTANRYVDQTVNLFDSTSNEFYLTGVQLEVGDKSTPFEHRSFSDELYTCRRYYCQSGANGVATESWAAGVTTHANYNYMQSDQLNSTADRHPVSWMWPTPMRASPTMTYYPARTAITNTAARINPYNSNTLVTFTGSPAARAERFGGYFQGTSTDSNMMTFNYTASAEI